MISHRSAFLCWLATTRAFPMTLTDAFSPNPTSNHPQQLLQSTSAIITAKTHLSNVATTTTTSTTTALKAFSLRDADIMEELVGGERYSMVPLPDSMMDTTLFVGNLNEFVKDEDLSEFFQTVSVLQSVPACVARKPNFDSMQYGFVAFPTVEEKEAAIMRFHGCKFMGKHLKVEPIRDHPKKGRVRVPEKIVSYVSGSVKKTRDGKTNTMRRISRVDDKKASDEKAKKNLQNKKKKQNVMKKKKKVIKLSAPDQAEFERALRKGYVTLQSTGYQNGRKSSPLACAHREWCDEQERPQIVLCKASGGRPKDCLIVDLSPLRVIGDEYLLQRKIDIMTSAANSGMELRAAKKDKINAGDDVVDVDIEDILCTETDDGSFDCVITISHEDISRPISKIPVQSLGVFMGERSQAKAMCSELAKLWDIPVQVDPSSMLSSSSSSSYSSSSSSSSSSPVSEKKAAALKRHKKRKANHHRRDGRHQNIRDLSNYL